MLEKIYCLPLEGVDIGEIILRHLGENAMVAWDRDFDDRSETDGFEMRVIDPPDQWYLYDGLCVTVTAAITAETGRYLDRPKYYGSTKWCYGCRILLVPDESNSLGCYWIDTTLISGPERNPERWREDFR